MVNRSVAINIDVSCIMNNEKYFKIKKYDLIVHKIHNNIDTTP